MPTQSWERALTSMDVSQDYGASHQAPGFNGIGASIPGQRGA